MSDLIGGRISKALEIRNMSQKELAEKAGITEATVSRYVNGVRIPRGQEVVKLSNALIVSCDFILGLSDSLNHQTNADRIRKMTDEELAEFMDKFSDNECECCHYKDMCRTCTQCKSGFLEWLQSESEEE